MSFLEQKYVVERLSIAQISELCFSSKAAIRANLLRFKIPIRELGKPHGRPSQPRYGKKIVNGHEVEHKHEARITATVCELHRQGLSLRSIAKVLSDMKIPTKCRGKSWHPEMIKRLLSRH